MTAQGLACVAISHAPPRPERCICSSVSSSQGGTGRPGGCTDVGQHDKLPFSSRSACSKPPPWAPPPAAPRPSPQPPTSPMSFSSSHKLLGLPLLDLLLDHLSSSSPRSLKKSSCSSGAGRGQAAQGTEGACCPPQKEARHVKCAAQHSTAVRAHAARRRHTPMHGVVRNGHASMPWGRHLGAQLPCSHTTHIHTQTTHDAPPRQHRHIHSLHPVSHTNTRIAHARQQVALQGCSCQALCTAGAACCTRTINGT
jgi:hypothetical protein